MMPAVHLHDHPIIIKTVQGPTNCPLQAWEEREMGWENREMELETKLRRYEMQEKEQEDDTQEASISLITFLDLYFRSPLASLAYQT